MAVDEALARELESGVAVLRLYQWSNPTVSLGRNQPAEGEYDVDRATELGYTFVRRPTGGRAVLHDRELTYAVVLPDTALGGPRNIYTRVQTALAIALAAAGATDVRQEAESVRTAPRPSTQPCFATVLPGEVTLGGRKIVGSAQARIAGTVLQHGAILVHNDQSALRELALATSPPESQPPATLAGNGVPLAPPALAAHVLGAFKESIPGEYVTSQLTSAERLTAQILLEKFESPRWTWRR